jgi:hypothetical protein
VLVFPHDEWEDLDLEGGRAAKPVPPKPTDVETVSSKRGWETSSATDCHDCLSQLCVGHSDATGPQSGSETPSPSQPHTHTRPCNTTGT